MNQTTIEFETLRPLFNLFYPPHFDHASAVPAHNPSPERCIYARQRSNDILMVLQQILLTLGD